MWVVMMAAMMLPALVPTLLCYCLSLQGPRTIHLNSLTAIVGAGYFFVWALLGAVVYPFGVFVANAGMLLVRDSMAGGGKDLSTVGGFACEIPRL